MCEALVRAGAEVTVFTTNANAGAALDVPLRREVNEQGVRVWYFPVMPLVPHGYFLSPELSEACRRQIHRFDIVILETLFTQAMGPAVNACKRLSVPFVVPLRGQLLPWALKHKSLKKFLYLKLMGAGYLNHAAGLQCSDDIESEAVSALDFHSPAFVVPNGISMSEWNSLPLRGTLRQRFSIRTDELILLSLGRLHRVKRPDLALRTLAGLGRRDVHLVFAGPDEENYQARLLQEAETLGCTARVHFTGLLPHQEILQAFADSDLLVMPSAMESFGMAVVEALAAGLPVLVSENVPIGRWVERSGAGHMVPMEVDALVHSAKSMLSDRSGLEQMGRRGRTLAREQFDISNVAQVALSHYDSIVRKGVPLS
jgi:glycosyltransferase involved in cell wall biosynthesis